MNKIIPKFRDSLFQNATNIIQDYAELGIDSFLDEGIVKEIPIIKTIISGKKIINNIMERNLLKNLVIFIEELNTGNVDEEKIKKYREELNDSAKAERELGRFLFLLNQTFDNEKSIMYSKIYKAYINKKIDWNKTLEFTEIVSRMFIQDLDILEDLYNRKIYTVSNFNTNRTLSFRIERLYSLGIVGYSAKAMYPGGGVENFANLNEIGKLFAATIFE